MKTQAVIDHIVAWLTDYCRRAQTNGFVVGVSGGIDSAVTSTLCAKTGLAVTAVSLPIRPQPGQPSLADDHIRWLTRHFANVNGTAIDLTPAFTGIEQSLPAEIQDGLSMANTRSRLRMLTLYALATHHQQLVVGTGNKVEDFGVGFYTKYGDGGVDIAPIADLLKSEVYALGSTLEIAKAIRTAPPTDGLWEDQRTDETQLGASYDELEWAMAFREHPGDTSRLTDRQKTILSIYDAFNQKNQHKMQPIPVCHIPTHLK